MGLPENIYAERKKYAFNTKDWANHHLGCTVISALDLLEGRIFSLSKNLKFKNFKEKL